MQGLSGVDSELRVYSNGLFDDEIAVREHQSKQLLPIQSPAALAACKQVSQSTLPLTSSPFCCCSRAIISHEEGCSVDHRDNSTGSDHHKQWQQAFLLHSSASSRFVEHCIIAESLLSDLMHMSSQIIVADVSVCMQVADDGMSALIASTASMALGPQTSANEHLEEITSNRTYGMDVVVGQLPSHLIHFVSFTPLCKDIHCLSYLCGVPYCHPLACCSTARCCCLSPRGSI